MAVQIVTRLRYAGIGVELQANENCRTPRHNKAVEAIGYRSLDRKLRTR